MGDVVCLRTYRFMRDGEMTLEEAQRLVGYIDWKIANKRAMDEPDLFLSAAFPKAFMASHPTLTIFGSSTGSS